MFPIDDRKPRVLEVAHTFQKRPPKIHPCRRSRRRRQRPDSGFWFRRPRHGNVRPGTQVQYGNDRCEDRRSLVPWPRKPQVQKAPGENLETPIQNQQRFLRGHNGSNQRVIAANHSRASHPHQSIRPPRQPGSQSSPKPKNPKCHRNIQQTTHESHNLHFTSMDRIPRMSPRNETRALQKSHHDGFSGWILLTAFNAVCNRPPA